MNNTNTLLLQIYDEVSFLSVFTLILFISVVTLSLVCFYLYKKIQLLEIQSNYRKP
jgi:hypothetical protein